MLLRVPVLHAGGTARLYGTLAWATEWLDAPDVLEGRGYALELRVYEHALARAGFGPHEVGFVGDSWGPDVEGPAHLGIRPVHLRRGYGTVIRQERTTVRVGSREMPVTVATDLWEVVALFTDAGG